MIECSFVYAPMESFDLLQRSFHFLNESLYFAVLHCHTTTSVLVILARVFVHSHSRTFRICARCAGEMGDKLQRSDSQWTPGAALPISTMIHSRQEVGGAGTQMGQRKSVPGCRFWSQNISTFILISPRANIPKYCTSILEFWRYFQPSF